MVRKVVLLLGVVALAGVPVLLVGPGNATAAESSTTIETKDRKTGQPIDSVCYSVGDEIRRGTIAAACDADDGANDGVTTVSSSDPCTSCRFVQSLRDDRETGLPTEYVREPDQLDGWGGSRVFENLAKPRIQIKTVDARTGKRLKGVCYGIADLSNGGGLGIICDGSSFDADGARNGTVLTKVVEPGRTYGLHQKQPPRDYRPAKDKRVTAEAGKVAAATFKNRER